MRDPQYLLERVDDAAVVQLYADGFAELPLDQKALFETYGIHFDPALRDEVVARVERLDLPSYTGFVMPRLEPVRREDGAIDDVRITYPRDLSAQMLEYSALTRATRRL
jgi:hypothetical protein